MKKVFLAAALALFAATDAQTRFGLKAGYSNSVLNSSDEAQLEGIGMDKKEKSGFYAGAFGEYQLTEKFALQGELQYAKLGGNYSGSFAQDGMSFTMDMGFNIDQIIVPVSAKYYVTPALGLTAGPYAAFTVSNNVTVDANSPNLTAEENSMLNSLLAQYENELTNEFDRSLEKTNFGIHIGAEYTVYRSLFLEARYNIGLSNLEKDTDTETKMNFFQVGLGWKF